MRSMKKAVSLFVAVALILTTCNSAAVIQAAQKKNANAKVSFVKITNTGKKLQIQKGKKFRLETSIKVKPNKSKFKKLTFTSSNRKVALVNSRGLLKGLKVGTARITVASKVNPKKGASIAVTVTKDVLVSSIKLNKKKITADEFNEEEIPLKVTKILPAKAKNKKVIWSTSDEDVADVDDEGVVTTGNVGTATITATAADHGGAFATCKVIVTENEDQGDDDNDREETETRPNETAPSVAVTSKSPAQDHNSPEPEERVSSEPGLVTAEPGTDRPGDVTPEPATGKPGIVTSEPATARPGDGTEKPSPTPTRKPIQTPEPAWTPDPDVRLEDYEYFNDYTLGWSDGIVAYKDGKKMSLADAGADVYNINTDRIFGQHFNNNKWDDAKIKLTPPLQYTTRDGKVHNVNSTLSNWNFCADPGAIDNSDVDGKLYVYGTTEGIEYDNNGVLKLNGYNNHSLTIMSTKDMVNWTDEGTLDNLNLANDLSYIEDKTKCGWASRAWAPSGLKIDGDRDGKEEYYIFYSNGSAVGYVQGDSPTGPWKDDLGRVLISKSTPNCNDVVWCFDPAVLVDDKGDAYVYFGGGVPDNGNPSDEQKAHPQTGRVCKIKFEEGTGKVLLDGDPQKLDAYYMFENSEINQFHGKYFYSYTTNFWVPGSLKAPGALAPIGIGQIACYVSKDPMNITFDPDEQDSADDLKYLGAIINNPSSIYGQSYNNHHHMQSFKGHEYMFYHSTVLGNTLFRDKKDYRNLHVDEITVDEETDAISMEPSYEGASQIEDFEPYKNEDGSVKYINATTAASSAGVKSTRDDRMAAGSINGSPMVLDEIDTGDWSCIRGVDFGASGLNNFGVEYVSDSDVGRIELFIDSPTKAENQVAAINISGKTNGKYVYRSVATRTVTGKHDVYFVFRGNDYKVASWSFSETAEGSSPDISDRPDIPTPRPTSKPTQKPTLRPTSKPTQKPTCKPVWTTDPEVTPDPFVPEGEGWMKLDLSLCTGDETHYTEQGDQIYLDQTAYGTIPIPKVLENVGDKIEIIVRGSLSDSSTGFRFWLANDGDNTMTEQYYFTQDSVGVGKDSGNGDEFIYRRNPFQIQTVLQYTNWENSENILATKLVLKEPSYGYPLEGVTITGIWVRYGEAIGAAATSST